MHVCKPVTIDGGIVKHVVGYCEPVTDGCMPRFVELEMFDERVMAYRLVSYLNGGSKDNYTVILVTRSKS